jgi:hypothetical protein
MPGLPAALRTLSLLCLRELGIFLGVERNIRIMCEIEHGRYLRENDYDIMTHDRDRLVATDVGDHTTSGQLDM